MARATVDGHPWSADPEALLHALAVDPAEGLSKREAQARRQRLGPNALHAFATADWWRVLGRQFASLVMALLIGAGALAFAFGEVVEGFAVLALIALNVAIGFGMELRAVRSMEALRRLGSVTATVRRDGTTQAVPAEDLVPGDIVLLEGGDIVSADVRILQASRLQADESTLTGESDPVTKAAGFASPDAPIHARQNILHKGTTITRGSAEAVVVATAQDTELGHIATLVQSATSEATPLEKRLEALGRRLIVAVLAIAALVAVLGIVRGKDPFLMVETGIALAIAAVPEGLPVVATLALARGMLRMARRNALVRRLAAVETLGSTSIICLDKTGTLTENRMTVTKVVTDDGTVVVGAATDASAFVGGSTSVGGSTLLQRLLETGTLCNNAALSPDGGPAMGDPMEAALLVAARKADIRRPELVAALPERREEAFDPERKLMATVHARPDGRFRIAVKGAPEAVLQTCTRLATARGDIALGPEAAEGWHGANATLADEGLRVLALAERVAPTEHGPPFEELTLLGLVGLIDPPRADARDALARCREAGMRVVMVTGDQAGTARRVALAVGMSDDPEVPVVEGQMLARLDREDPAAVDRVRRASIFARVSPQQKLDIITIHQSAGAVVAMTGDGVNDAPALKKADIGVAMGQRGTQVAREAADLVLKDDAFPTIVDAVQQGRAIFSNIRRFAYYLLSCNVGEVAIIALAALADAPLPLLPLQILFLNLVTDVFPALALGFGKGEPMEMRRPPRPRDEPFLTRGHWWAIIGYGSLFAGAVLAAFFIALGPLGHDATTAVTVSFLTLALAQLWHVLNMRDAASRLVRNDVTQNPYVWGAVILSATAVLAAVYVPALANVLDLTPPDGASWLLAFGASLVPVVVGQVTKPLVRRLRDRRARATSGAASGSP